MRAPLLGRRLVVVGATATCRVVARLLEQLGAELTLIERVAGADHSARLESVDADGAVDGVGVFDAPIFPVVRLGAEANGQWHAAGVASLAPDDDREAGVELAPMVAAYGALVQLFAAMAGRELNVDPFGCLTERAVLTGMAPSGQTSAGGSARFEQCRDGWVALNLARPEDLAALPALVGRSVDPADWPEVAALLQRMDAHDVVERANLLGVPAAIPGETASVGSPWLIDAMVPRGAPLRRRAVPEPPAAEALVVDFSSMWAGPLAGAILADRGARVIKVESASRPDGARLGPKRFFDRLNATKESLVVDFDDEGALGELRELVDDADVVIEASRPRALVQLGFDAEATADRGTCWISITGHGRGSDRVAFGDDAAVAGGLASGTPPRFVGDAIADPIAGLAAASAALAALVGRCGQIIEVPMAAGIAFGLESARL